ncbi:CCRG-2 family RiPP [Prochlorococcus marinus]|uniref:CCRG-2 family RiPP n=1 Tax=Prochlorococcus marinus TaxID=1219 RepID=UPI0022B4203D|nr:CCRG-2 family RiPP [Prochlorococcus marinus]
MNNTELTLDQLSEVSGGGVFAKLDGFKQVIHPQFKKLNIWTSGGTTSVWTTGPVTGFQKDVVKNFILEVPMC